MELLVVLWAFLLVVVAWKFCRHEIIFFYYRAVMDSFHLHITEQCKGDWTEVQEYSLVLCMSMTGDNLK